MPGGFKVSDATGQSLAYIYSRENENDAQGGQEPPGLAAAGSRVTGLTGRL